ncbi:MAG: hypothetical protein WCB05_09640 [Candidatus Sulfotelmatobacter sp.]|jgi:hypothetical protein
MASGGLYQGSRSRHILALMELVLNLAWLLLALPAYWLWRDSRGVRDGRVVTAVQCLLALGCMLVMLFPVISATDDLRAMRTEFEESPSSKRSICLKSCDKPSAWKWQSPASLVVHSSFSTVSAQEWHHRQAAPTFTPAAPVVERTGRAPPKTFLA